MYSVKAINGYVYGPVDLSQIRLWIGEGRVLPDTILIDHSTNAEAPAIQFPLVAIHFQPAAAPGYSQYPPPGPYGMPPGPVVNNYMMPPQPYYGQPKQMLVAGLLALFLGGLGIHQFYLGKTGLGVIMLVANLLGFLTCGVTSLAVFIWAVVDVILIFTGVTRDAYGRPLM